MALPEENIARAVGICVGLFPKQVAVILAKNNIDDNPLELNSDQMVDAVYNGLHTSETFNKDFTDFLAQNADTIRDAASTQK